MLKCGCCGRYCSDSVYMTIKFSQVKRVMMKGMYCLDKHIGIVLDIHVSSVWNY